MGYRIGDETVAFEGKLKHTTAKALLIEPTLGGEEVWIPKGQLVSQSEPDGDGNIEWTITEWIAKKNGLI